MDILQLILHNLFAFILIISIIVFIHEFGHFYVARLCKVKVEQFSIGFGRELFGFVDKHGTRWKFCILPMGGYVKMYGDRNAASIPDSEMVANMSDEEKKHSFIAKKVWQRMAVVAAGPVANFILAILLFTLMFRINGINTTLPIVDEIQENSAAFAAGIKKGDKILVINDKQIKDFSDIKEVALASKDSELNFQILRNEKIINISLTPKVTKIKDFFGDEIKVPLIGIMSSQVETKKVNIVESFGHSVVETYRVSIAIFHAIGELITGKRDVKELGGPIKIAKYSGATFDMGFWAVIWFMTMISINLGIMNLLPVPVLDGGHLFYYLIEAIIGKPLPQKVQMAGYQLGFGLVLTLMLFTTFNDIRSLF